MAFDLGGLLDALKPIWGLFNGGGSSPGTGGGGSTPSIPSTPAAPVSPGTGNMNFGSSIQNVFGTPEYLDYARNVFGPRYNYVESDVMPEQNFAKNSILLGPFADQYAKKYGVSNTAGSPVLFSGNGAQITSPMREWMSGKGNAYGNVNLPANTTNLTTNNLPPTTPLTNTTPNPGNTYSFNYTDNLNQSGKRNVYGNDVDLGYAKQYWDPMHYNFIQTDTAPATFNASDIFLGPLGSGYNGTLPVNTLYGADRKDTEEKIKGIGRYDKASDEYDAGYNKLVNAINESAARQTTALNKAKASMGRGYDAQVKSQKSYGDMARNNYNNNTISRGLGRSTIATTGMAGIDNATNSDIANINAARADAMGNIDDQIANLNIDAENTLQDLANTRNADISKLLESWKDRDYQQGITNAQMTGYMPDGTPTMNLGQLLGSIGGQPTLQAQQFAASQDPNSIANMLAIAGLTGMLPGGIPTLAMQQFNYQKSRPTGGSGGGGSTPNAPSITEMNYQEKQDSDNALIEAKDYLNKWAGGEGGTRATRTDILDYIDENEADLLIGGVDVDALRKWAKSRFLWDKQADGTWYDTSQE
jgi:hypothetical protein